MDLFDAPMRRVLVCVLAAAASLAAVCATAATPEPASSVAATAANASRPPSIAVFEFELENVSPTGEAWGETSEDTPYMQALTATVRRQLEASGVYTTIPTDGVDDAAAKSRTLRNCRGCDADIALKLGADRSLIGVVSRAGSTEYYVSIRLTDTHRHAVVFRKMAFFIGGEDAWPVGVHEVVESALAGAEH